MSDQEMKLLEERLDNWGLVVRDGLHFSHCASVEYRYQPERGESFEARRNPGPVLDVADGWLVERAWKLLGKAHHRWLLKLHFVRKMPRNGVIKWVAKRTGYSIKTWDYKGELFYAMRQLQKMLDTRYHDADNRGQQFDSLLK
jgi:hypothetical protein